MPRLYIFTPTMEDRMDPLTFPAAVSGQVVAVQRMLGKDVAVITTPDGQVPLGVATAESLTPIHSQRTRFVKYDQTTGHTAESQKNVC